jgi:hypothetical protein
MRLMTFAGARSLVQFVQKIKSEHSLPDPSKIEPRTSQQETNGRMLQRRRRDCHAARRFFKASFVAMVLIKNLAWARLKPWNPSLGKAAMKRCAQCHGKLGLGVRFRNLWDGRWWVHLRFCSAHCEGNYELAATTPTPSIAGTPSSIAVLRRTRAR